MRIVTVDGRDDAAFERFFRLRDEVRRRETAYPTGLGRRESQVIFTRTGGDVRVEGLAAVDGDRWLGVAWLDWWLLENTAEVDVELAVDARYRRQGVGSRLLAAVRERVRAAGRTRLTSSVIADPGTSTSTGTAFAEAHGFVRVHVELHQVMELPLDESKLAELDRPVPGYEILQWRERTPDEWAEQFAEALTVMSEDVPHGNREVEVARWTPERIHAAEDRRVAQGRFCFTTVAVDGAGALAAYTQLGGAADARDRLYQFDTFVRPEHRGRRLGLAVKVPNLRALQADLDEPAVLNTWNAPENTPMIAVNTRLGYRPVAHRVAYQLDVG